MGPGVGERVKEEFDRVKTYQPEHKVAVFVNCVSEKKNPGYLLATGAMLWSCIPLRLYGSEGEGQIYNLAVVQFPEVPSFSPFQDICCQGSVFDTVGEDLNLAYVTVLFNRQSDFDGSPNPWMHFQLMLIEVHE